MRRLIPAGAGVVVIGCLTASAVAPSCAAAGASPVTAGPRPAAAARLHLNRSFQALYLLPAGTRADPQAPAAIRNDVNRINGWYRSQTVGRVEPRWVRHPGHPLSVVTVTLRHHARKYNKSASQLSLIAGDLKAAGWPRASKEKLVAFIDVKTAASGGYCAITGSGLSVISEAACGIYPSADDRWPYGATYVTAHEMAHNFGAVPDCAPHSDGTGHVNDDPRDLLYNGKSARNWQHLKLDPGHDDYYDTPGHGCADIKDSRFWTSP